MDRKSKLELGGKDESGTNTEPFQRTGSFRKVLPSKPSSTVDSRLSMSMKMIERPVMSSSPQNGNNKAFNNFMLEYAILAEYQMLQKQELSGIYVIPSDEDPLVWFGVTFIHQGLYRGGVFRFVVQLPENFPDGDCPKVTFERKVFHPAVNYETGELNVAEEFQEWNKKMNHIWQVLQYTKRIFFKLEIRSPANEEASDMYVKDNTRFQELAKKCADENAESIFESVNSILSNDPNYIRFETYDESVHENVRESLTEQQGLDKIRNF